MSMPKPETIGNEYEEPIPEFIAQRLDIQAGEKTWDDYSFEERTCKGWLIPHLLDIETMFWGRWVYWMRTLEAGELLDDPIPRLPIATEGYSGYSEKHKGKFGIGPGHSPTDTHKMLMRCLEDHRAYASGVRLSDFLEWLLWGFGNPDLEDRPRMVDERLNEHWYRTFNLGLMIKFPKDYFGDIYAEERSPSSNRRSGFYPTPHTICEFMTLMNFGEGDKDTLALAVCEPCVGTGRMLMHASNYSVNLYGMDIDRVCVMACKVNAYLYMPWMIRPAPWLAMTDTIRQEDSIRNPPTEPKTPTSSRKLIPIRKESQLKLFN